MEDLEKKQKRFQEITEAWSDHYGLISPLPDRQVSGNGIRYTSEWIYALLSEGVISRERAYVILSMLYYGCLNTLDPKDKRTQPVDGNLKRHPDHYEQEGPDDYIAFLSIAHTAGTLFPFMILNHGLDTGFWYNTERPYRKTKYSGKINWSAYMARFPQMICHMYLCCDLKPSIALRAAWCISILYTALFGKRHADTWVLSWHLVNVLSNQKRDYFIMRRFAKYWQKRMRKIWGEEGVRLALREYFGNGHPLGEYFPKGDII